MRFELFWYHVMILHETHAKQAFSQFKIAAREAPVTHLHYV